MRPWGAVASCSWARPVGASPFSACHQRLSFRALGTIRHHSAPRKPVSARVVSTHPAFSTVFAFVFFSLGRHNRTLSFLFFSRRRGKLARANCARARCTSLAQSMASAWSSRASSGRGDRAQSRPKVLRVSGSGHTVEGPFWRAKSARESSGGPGIFAFLSASEIGCSKPPSSIWPLPETPSTGVRPWGAVASCSWARPVRPNPIKPGRAGGSGGRARGEGGMAPEGRPGARSARGSLRPWMQKL